MEATAFLAAKMSRRRGFVLETGAFGAWGDGAGLQNKSLRGAICVRGSARRGGGRRGVVLDATDYEQSLA